MVSRKLRVRGPVLFDVDGTLLLGSVGHLVVLAEVLGRHVGTEVPIHIDGERPMLGDVVVAGWIDVEIVRHVLEAASTNQAEADASRAAAAETEVAEVMAAFAQAYAAIPASRIGEARPVPGAAACLERLQAARTPLGLVTGNASFVARAKFEALGLDRFFRFDRDLGFGDWRANRPAVAAAAIEGLTRDGLDAGSVSYVGDTPRDMQAARAVGARPIGVLTGASRATELEHAGADVVIASVADLYPG